MRGKSALNLQRGPRDSPKQDGKAALVQAASVSIHGPHGQHIENIHLEKYTSSEDFFDRLYEGPYKKLLTKAEQFVKATGGSNSDTLVFIRYSGQLEAFPLT